MKKINLACSVALLFVASCVGYSSQDEDIEEGSLETLTQTLRKSEGGTNFDWDYCAPPYASPSCVEGEGDCDSDADCEAGLICGTDNGWRYGMPASMDVCWDASCDENTCGGACPPCDCTGTLWDADFCTSTCQCSNGEGDCDADADCAGTSVCGQDNGDLFGESRSTDVCWDASCASRTPNSFNFCSAACPCRTGEGDCDPNAGHCGPGLACGTDNGPQFGSYATNDICWPAICNTRPLWDWAKCTIECPCAEGEGDCDTDADCGPGLVCNQNVGAAHGQHPTMDVCEAQ